VPSGVGSWPRRAPGTPAPDGSFFFVLQQRFTEESTYLVSVAGTDPFGSFGAASTRVFVLPSGKVLASPSAVAQPGETVSPALDDGKGTSLTASFTHDAGPPR